ncbi:hypothetical protein HGRIS_005093 [Hohenbuehelia grisea]|uniref:Major facilitator superfamily (MFS) profile domain-containing protein n=1 Tax=Hohenbuehelia grisea TaxID=104357 RepID=A0ABR3JDX4_9AGAR
MHINFGDWSHAGTCVTLFYDRINAIFAMISVSFPSIRFFGVRTTFVTSLRSEVPIGSFSPSFFEDIKTSSVCCIQIAQSSKSLERPSSLLVAIMPNLSTSLNTDAPSLSSQKSEKQSEPLVDEFPEGGIRAWLVVLGSFLCLFSTFGIVNAFGVFQEYYSSTLLPSSPPSVIALIGAIQLFLLYGLGPVVGRVFDAFGTKVLVPLGSFITVISIMMTSLCQKDQPYQFFLTQGILFGIGNAMLFTPALAIVSHWFHRRRAFAIGIAASGSSLGGVVYPIMLKSLISKLGFAWAVRICGFLTLACLVISCIIMRPRFPPLGTMSIASAVDFGGFRDVRYSLTAVSAFLLFYALFIPYFYIEDYAKYYDVSPVVTRYLLAILNACGVPARIIPGIAADKLGPLNILVPSTFISALLILAVWLPSRGAASILSFGALYGLFSGSFLALLPAYIAAISPRAHYGARLGMIYLIVAIANLIGTPSAGAFIKTINAEHFRNLIIFTGLLVTCGGLTLTIVRVVDSRANHRKK